MNRISFAALTAALILSGRGVTISETVSDSPRSIPDFGPNVLLFDPSMTNIQSRLDTIFSQQARSEFGSNRFVYLFKPGNYHLDVQAGYYMQVLGLGKSPDDVAITGAVRSKATGRNGNATINFWRAVENLSVTPTLDQHTNLWAVSQGTALRRVHVKGNLTFSDGGWSSGGFMADCKIDGRVNSGTQQQWLSRNDDWGGWTGGAWNMVFVGVVNPPAGAWPTEPYTVIAQTPLVREKPYLFMDWDGNYFVMVPHLETNGTQGITWSKGATPGTPLPINQFYLAHPEKDNAASINAALKQGKHLLLTPGIYHMEGSIQVSRPDTVVLGLGYPTLVPDQGTPALTVSDVDGVKEAFFSRRGQTIPPRCCWSDRRAVQRLTPRTRSFSTTFSAGLAARRPEVLPTWSPSTATTSWATISGSGARTTAGVWGGT